MPMLVLIEIEFLGFFSRLFRLEKMLLPDCNYFFLVPSVSCISSDNLVSSLWDTVYMPDFPVYSQQG